jgi:hypothetical protein
VFHQKLRLCAVALAIHALSHTQASALAFEAYLGGGASQLNLTSTTRTNKSDGYLAPVLGGGVSYSFASFLDFEADALYVQRKFGLFDVKTSFPVLQIPVFAKFQYKPFQLNFGLYSALWVFNGEMLQGETTSEVSPADAGLKTSEIGMTAGAGYTFSVRGIPLRAEIRWQKSMTPVATDANLTSSIVEYQCLLAYEFGGRK